MSKVSRLLAQFEAKRKAASKAPRKSAEELWEDKIEQQSEIIRMLNADHHIPDPAGIHREPDSIHSPAPAPRIRFERPRKRKGRDPHAVGKDCEIPDYRRSGTYTIEDSDGRARGAIEINPFSKRIRVGGFGLVEGKR